MKYLDRISQNIKYEREEEKNEGERILKKGCEEPLIYR